MFKKIVFGFVLISLPVIGFSQYNLDIGFNLGGSNYLGDIGGKDQTRREFISDMKVSQTRFIIGGFARYRIIPKLSAKVGLNWVRISGDDKLSTNPGRAGRNLNFRTDIYELDLTAQYVFYEIPDLGRTMRFRNDFKMYAFAGVGAFYYNPKALYNGQYVALRPLMTEGKKYGAVNVSLPLGIGLFFTFDKVHRIGWDFSWRTTFTDYLDDISTVYADPATLPNQMSVDLANRRDELGETPGIPHPKNYEPGSKRGDPSHKDTYLSTSLSYSYVLRGKSSFYKSRYGSVFKGNTRNRRKVRAKF